MPSVTESVYVVGPFLSMGSISLGSTNHNRKYSEKSNNIVCSHLALALLLHAYHLQASPPSPPEIQALGLQLADRPPLHKEDELEVVA